MRLTKLAPALISVLVMSACAGATGSPTPASTTSAQPTNSATATPSASPMMSMDDGSMSPMPSATSSASGDINITSDAANFRTSLNYLLGEHLILAAKATGAALGGRTDEFNAYATLLNTNGTDLGAAIGSIYGMDAQDEFNRIWSAHNGFFVDYTTGVATNDEAKKTEAVNNLTTVYVPEFTDFLVGATGLPEGDVTTLVTDHVLHTKAVVDAQAAGDWSAAAAADRLAAMHMRMIGDPLASAIVASMPDKF